MARSKSTANELRVKFKHFRQHRKIDNISEIYELKRLIGAGSYGKVYEAWNVRANEPCAIKVICKVRNPEVTVCPEVVILGDLDHPHIVQLLDLCEDDEFLYIIMELMRYGTLTDAMIRIV